MEIIAAHFASEEEATSAGAQLELAEIPFEVENRPGVDGVQPWVLLVEDQYLDLAEDVLRPNRSRHHKGVVSPEQYRETERALAADRERQALEAELVDPLSSVTRKERTSLLAVATLGAAVSLGGLVPEEINALGIRVSHFNQAVLLGILLVSVLYFRVAFTLYARADVARWSHRFHRSVQLFRLAREVQCATCHDIIQPDNEDIAEPWRDYTAVFRRRGLFDVIVPKVAADAAALSLAWRIWRVLVGA